MRGSVGVIGSCIVLLLAPAGIVACGGDSGGKTVAMVGDLPVTSAELAHWTSMPGVVGSAAARSIGSPPSAATARQRTLAFLIACARTVAETREKGIVVSDAEARATIRLLHEERFAGVAPEPRSRQAGIASLVGGGRETAADRVWIAKVYLLAERLRQRQLTEAEQSLSPAQLADYYSHNERSFRLPERRRVAAILTWHKSDIEAAKREIESGKPLADVVGSRDDEPAVGGFKTLSLKTLPHAFEREYFSARPHVLVGPHRVELYYLFEVLEIKAPRQRSLAEVQPIVRRELIAGAQHHVVTDAVAALEQRWKARTRCRPGFVVQQCGGRLS